MFFRLEFFCMKILKTMYCTSRQLVQAFSFLDIHMYMYSHVDTVYMYMYVHSVISIN